MISQSIHKNILASTVLAFVLMQTGCATGLRDTSGVDHLLLQLDSNRSQVKIGEPVQLRFTITNTGQNYIVVESTDTAVMDINVKVVGGEQLLSWSAQNPDQVAHEVAWKPGESKVIEWIWVPKQEDIYIGAFHNIFLTGLLYKDGKILQSAGVTVCASNVCR